MFGVMRQDKGDQKLDKENIQVEEHGDKGRILMCIALNEAQMCIEYSKTEKKDQL